MHSDPAVPKPHLVVDSHFVQQHGTWMLRVATRILADEALAEDAVQAALLQVHEHGARFEGRSNVKTWLYRITVNAALTILRKRVDETHHHENTPDAWQPLFDSHACRIEEPWTALASPEEILEQADLAAHVHACVESLPETYRICLQLRDFEDLSIIEVAHILDITPENAKVRVHRARSALKRMIEPLLRGRSVTELTPPIGDEKIAPSLGRRLKGLMTAYLPLMLTCEQFEHFIMDYLEDTLPKHKRQIFELHIRTCRECREYLAAYQRAREISAGASATTSLRDVPSDLLEAVLAAL